MSLKDWVTAICFAAVATGLLSMLIPRGNGEKLMRSLLGMFMLCVLVLPVLKGIKWDSPISAPGGTASAQASALTAEMVTETERAAAAALEPQVAVVVQGAGIATAKVALTMDRNKSGSILLKQITVFVHRADVQKVPQAKALLKTRLGLDADFAYLPEDATNGEE